jgi:hypothetical protein
VHGDSELTSLNNEEHDKVRNSHRDTGDSARLDRLVHGRCPEDRTGYEALLHSFGGLMLVGFLWSSLPSPCSITVVQLTSISTVFPNNTWRYVALYSDVTEVILGAGLDNTLIELD